jgi:hypothetical protein
MCANSPQPAEISFQTFYRKSSRQGLANQLLPLKKGGAVAMSFGIYLVGYIILIVGLAMGAHLMHMPPRWIGVGVIIMVGIGVITGVTATRNRDSSS